MSKINILLSVGKSENKIAMLPFIEIAAENENVVLYATENTHEFLKKNNISSVRVYKISEIGKYPNISELISKKTFNIIVNIPSREITEKAADYTDGEIIRKTAAEYGLIAITDLDVAEIILGNIGSK